MKKNVLVGTKITKHFNTLDNIWYFARLFVTLQP